MAAAILAIALLAAAPLTAFAETVDTGRLWRIAKSGIPDSFVLGTIHVADPRVATISKPVASALARSRYLAVELVPEAADPRTAELEELEDGKRLEPMIGADAYLRLRNELEAQGVRRPVIEHLKPWAAMMKLSRVAAKPGQKTLEEALFLAARNRRLRVLPLELLEEKVAALDAVPRDAQVAMLRHALDHRDALTANVEATVEAWLRGDLEGLARVSDRTYEQFPALRDHYSRLIQHVIYDRTAVMHHRLFMPLRQGRVFVAMGVLHLYGENGLLALLREDGFVVTRLW